MLTQRSPVATFSPRDAAYAMHGAALLAATPRALCVMPVARRDIEMRAALLYSAACAHAQRILT